MVNTKKVVFNTNLIYFIVIVCLVIVRVCNYLGIFSFLGDYRSIIVSIFTQVGLILVIPMILFKVLNKFSTKETFKFFSFKKVSIKTVFVCIALGLIVFFLNIYVSSFFNSIISMFGYKHAQYETSAYDGEWWMLIVNLLITAVLPAICEESLHRGMLLKGNSTLGMRKAIVLSGVLFGLLHLNIEQVFYASIIGLFLGYLCVGCNSIYPCMIIHFMNNATSVFLSFARANGWEIGNLFTHLSNFFMSNAMVGMLMFIFLICLLILVALQLTRFLLKDSFNYNFGKRHQQLANMAVRQSYFQQIEDIRNDNKSSSIYQVRENVFFIESGEFLKFINQNADKLFPKQELQVDSKVDVRTKILLYGSFALSIIVTLMTFFMGLL